MNAGRELATEEIREQKATIAAMSARIAALEAENARLHKFKNEAAHILHSLTSGVMRVMEEQLDQSRKVAAQMAKEIEDFIETGGK